MPEQDAKTKSAPGKGTAFFKRADEVAETGNWDFAIEMYLQGIEREPDNLERGHKPLRQVSLMRKAKGGKGPGMMETLKHRPGKDPLQNLLGAEYLLSKEPGSPQYMERVMSAARKLELRGVTEWVCDIMLEAQRQGKPNKRVLTLLTQTFHDLEAYGKAIQACEMARKLAPDDPQIIDALKDLSAKQAIQAGRYEEEGDFTRSVKDMDKQRDLVQKDALVKSRDYLEHEIERARKEYEESPTKPGKVNGLVDALLKFEDESYENEAVDILQKAHKDTEIYQFRMRIGDIKIRQMTRQYRQLVQAGDKKAAAEQARKQLEFELQEFKDRAANYPTDLAIKYELGRRHLLSDNLDEAIGALQQAQRDPRRRLMAMNYLGQAFARKGLLSEAADAYQRALQGEVSEKRELELRYSLGDVLTQMGRLAEAREEFSRVAQIDYGYQDTRKRLEDIDKRLAEASSEQGGE